MIADELTQIGFAELDSRKIHLAEPIKTVGDHEVDIRLMKDVIAKIKVHVGKEGGDDEAEEVKAEESNTEAPAETTEATA